MIKDDSAMLSPEMRKKRQRLLVLPLLILPFVTLAFWALGGGKTGVDAQLDTKSKNTAGINAVVPGANLSGKTQDKMTIYGEADQRSAARKQALGSQGYLLEADSLQQIQQQDGRSVINEAWRSYGTVAENSMDLSLSAGSDPNSQKVEEKLAALQALVNSAGNAAASPSRLAALPLPSGIDRSASEGKDGAHSTLRYNTGGQLDQLGRLNEQIAQMAGSGTANGSNNDGGGDDDDKETQQINAMLDKILAIQHPEKAGDKSKGLSKVNSGRDGVGVYPVNKAEEDLRVPVLTPELLDRGASVLTGSPERFMTNGGTKGEPNRELTDESKVESVSEMVETNNLETLKGFGDGVAVGAFYDIDQGRGMGEDSGSVSRYSLSAIIAETQTLVSGSTVKMELTTDVFIKGIRIPRGNYVFGTCSISGERLRVQITHMRYLNQLFAVGLTVYDMDGMEGVRIPGAIGRDASKEGADRALQSVQMMSLDPSVSAQAATAGIEAAKGLFSKKVKLVRVRVKAGYPVLLLDANGGQR